MYEEYTELLKSADKLRDDGDDVEQDFMYGNKNIEGKYNLWNLTGMADDFGIAVKVLEWISSHIYHNNYFKASIGRDAENLLEFSFDKEPEEGLNCRTMSIVLTECLLALNIKARTVYMMPASPFENDNYVVSEVWIPTMHKWVMLDGTIGGYVTDKEGNPLGVLEVRTALCEDKQLKFSKGIKYNREHIIAKEVLGHYAKYMYCIMTYSIQGTASEELKENKLIVGAPCGYDVMNSIRESITNRKNHFEEPEIFTTCEEDTDKIHLIYKGINFFKR